MSKIIIYHGLKDIIIIIVVKLIMIMVLVLLYLNIISKQRGILFIKLIRLTNWRSIKLVFTFAWSRYN